MNNEESENMARKLNISLARKKRAANDAQLLMNRIALLQKEEERARKKIEQTKEKALEIIKMRSDNERRMLSFVEASNEERAMQRQMQIKSKEQDFESRRALQLQARKLIEKKKEEADGLNWRKRHLTKQMIKEQELELLEKQRRRDEIRRQQEDARRRKEEEKREQERKVHEFYLKKSAEEEAETRRVEKLVKALEKKEREWMEKLQQAQSIQESAFNHLEYALARGESSFAGGSTSSTGGSPKSVSRVEEEDKMAERLAEVRISRSRPSGNASGKASGSGGRVVPRDASSKKKRAVSAPRGTR